MNHHQRDPFAPITYCERCGRPSIGQDRCPHAIDPRYECPNDPDGERALRERLRRLGR